MPTHPTGKPTFPRPGQFPSRRRMIIESLGKLGLTAKDARPFYGNVRMKVEALPERSVRESMNWLIKKFRRAGLRQVDVTLRSGENLSTVRKSKWATDAEAARWTQRHEFDLPQTAVNNNEGYIDSHYFFDTHNQFVAGLHICPQSAHQKGKYFWIDVPNIPGSNRTAQEILNRILQKKQSFRLKQRRQ
ncbi:MAG: hypothetical protein V1777_03695 [Candidatus Micrarchaeota archaeon]